MPLDNFHLALLVLFSVAGGLCGFLGFALQSLIRREKRLVDALCRARAALAPFAGSAMMWKWRRYHEHTTLRFPLHPEDPRQGASAQLCLKANAGDLWAAAEAYQLVRTTLGARVVTCTPIRIIEADQPSEAAMLEAGEE